MISLKSLAFLFLISYVTCDEVVDFVLNNLVDDSVEPCDNFYRHVCSVKTKNEFGAYAQEVFDKEINQNLDSNDSFSSFINELIKCNQTNGMKGTLSKNLKKGFRSACKRGEGSEFIQKLPKMFNLPSATCENSTELYATFDEVDAYFAQIYRDNCRWTVSNPKERIWLYQNKNIFESLKHILGDLKSIYRKWVQKTPFHVMNRNVTGRYLEIMDDFLVYDLSESKNIALLAEKYEECKETIAPLFENETVSNFICLQATVQQFKKPSSTFSKDFNAQFFYWRIVLGVPFLTMAKHIDMRSFLIGQLGSLIGIEMGHAVFPSKYEDPNRYFSHDTETCIQLQYCKTAFYFPEEDCKTLGKKLYNNGADLFGVRGSLLVAKQEFGSKFYQTSSEYSNLTHAQLFFYGLASPFCNSFNLDDKHTANEIRYNAMAAQSPEFQKAFQCEPNSEIAKSRHESCFKVVE